MNPALGQQPNFVSRSPGFLAISSQLKGYVTTLLKDKLVHKKRNHYHSCLSQGVISFVSILILKILDVALKIRILFEVMHYRKELAISEFFNFPL